MSEKSSKPDPHEDGTPPPNAGPDQTEPYVPLDDATAPYGPLDNATAPYEPLDDPDATRPLTRPEGIAAGGTAAGAWTGRAEVRGPVPPSGGEEWTDEEPEEPGRRWWMPILLGLLGVLVVIAAIAAAVLVNRNTTAPVPTPGVTHTAAPPASASPIPPPSSAPPSSAPPTASTVLVPPTAGDTLAVAKGKLEALGLVVRTSEREDPTAAPGTVLGTDPTAGSVVAEGSQITVIVAKAVPSTSPEPKPSPSQPRSGESLSPAAVPPGNQLPGRTRS